MDLIEITEKERLSREDAATRLHALAARKEHCSLSLCSPRAAFSAGSGFVSARSGYGGSGHGRLGQL
jgi:hypothetical protein